MASPLQLTHALEDVLASSYALYLKTQNYHWNVTGHEFRSLHLLFESQYEDLAEAIDEMAERLRILDQKVDASFSAFSQRSQLEDADKDHSADVMVEKLAQDQDVLVKLWAAVLKLAEAAGDAATADMAIKRMAVHEKNRWMLKSSL